MLDDIVKDNLRGVLESIELVQSRFADITLANDLVSTPEGVMILDSIAMRLQVIGELLKKCDKIEPSLFKEYKEVPWDNIMRLRDIISHHYDTVDHEIIFDICKNHIPKLAVTVRKIIASEETIA